MSTSSHTSTATYSTADVEAVMLRVKTDFLMIADSSKAWTREKAANYATDVELLAKKGYLSSVDVTLMEGSFERRAVFYDVVTDGSSGKTQRPGAVMWPALNNAWIRVIITYTAKYDAAAREAMRGKLKISWGPANDDTSHSSLTENGNRDYTSNAFGMKRKDWTK